MEKHPIKMGPAEKHPIKMVPACGVCGNMLYDVSVETNIREVCGLKVAHHTLSPESCPRCGAAFDRVEYPWPFPSRKEEHHD